MVKEDTFTTMSGRNLNFPFISGPGYSAKMDCAMGSLKAAMKWEQERFKTEHDLDLHNVVSGRLQLQRHV